MKTSSSIVRDHDLRRLRSIATRLVILLFLLLALPGCTSPKYKPAPKKTPPPVLLNLPSTEPPVETLLHTVIIYRGPGSWKLDAFWDEYVVTVANRGHAQVTIESAEVVDFQDTTIAAGQDPWKLEEASRIFAEQDIEKAVPIQIGANLGVVAFGSGVGVMLFSGGTIATSAGAAAGGFVALPAVIGGSIYLNLSNRSLIEREFQRRRVKLPATLLPGEFVAGSFFFRIAPSPKRLLLHCRVEGEPHEVVIELAPLAGTHLQRIRAEVPKPASPPAK